MESEKQKKKNKPKNKKLENVFTRNKQKKNLLGIKYDTTNRMN